jgi:adenylate cyclase
MRYVVTVLFADCRGFTPLARVLPPEQLVHTMNHFFEATVDVLLQHDACVDKFLGDEVMAVFGAPIPRPDHAQQAFEAAIEIQRAARDLFAQIAVESEGAGQIEIGIAINTGEAIVGNVGSTYVSDFTAIGESVNIAANLQDLAGPGEVLVTEETYRALATPPSNGSLREVMLKGGESPISVHAFRPS